jgi:hypothetical protein
MAIDGRYDGLVWELGFVPAEVTSVDVQIRLLGGQYIMRDLRLGRLRKAKGIINLDFHSSAVNAIKHTSTAAQ